MGAAHEVSISLDGVRDKNLMQLKKLNLALFPVRYNDKYYTNALASGEFTKLGYGQTFKYFGKATYRDSVCETQR
ncbi:Putative N-acetyltransferase san [Glycine soja]|uniref:Putative N-acetyltransferase san n=1 Tax=Glycine soja TaxID=3848 RepID=A0A0B2NQS1_GLYSO|nr:Putative N-acetyltransferase san [Glycine soja]